VHIFKVFILISFGIINAQRIDSLFSQLYEEGEWKSFYQLNNSNEYEFIQINSRIDSMYFLHQNNVQGSVLKSLFKPILGLSTRSQALRQLRVIKSAYPFIDDGSFLSFAKYDNNRIAAVVDFNPVFKSQIGGLLGASKGKEGEWISTGEIDIHLENPREKGSILDLKWQQPDANTRKLYFSIETPFLFSLPFGTLIQLDQNFIENSYYIESTSGLLTGLSPFGQWRFGGKKESGKDLSQNKKFSSKSILLGLKVDRRNNRWLPYSGQFFETAMTLGNFNDHFGKTTMFESKFKFQKYKNIGNSVILVFSQGESVLLNNRKLISAKKVKYGGINTIRGYRENQFASEWIFIQTFELLFGNLKQSQSFIFIDIPAVSNYTIHPGYGLGFRQYKGTIALDISIGFSKRSAGGKIHIKFSSKL
jgi:hypothetical protein|tara:strand:+ start:2620 stop:3879 length:1260 start_codon:yes stop_codon:yes gene_type:complete